MKRSRLYHLVVMSTLPVIIPLLSGTFLACANKSDQNESALNSGVALAGQLGSQVNAFPVKTEPAVRRTISEYIITNTTLEATRMLDIPAKSSGQVVELLAEEGDRVAEGSILARLDQREILLSVREARLDLENSVRNFERQEELRKTNIISEEEFEHQRYLLEISKIGLKQAELKLANTEIVAPISGIIIERFIDLGDSLSNNQKTFSVGDFDTLLARIFIPEREMNKVRIGQSVRISIESSPENEYEGSVKRISPVVDAASGTIKVTIEIHSPGSSLKPGMFVTVFLATATHADALTIPKKAIVLEREQEVVYIIREGKAVRVPIETGFTESEYIEIVVGLNAGDDIIVIGQENIQDGSSVRAVVARQASADPDSKQSDLSANRLSTGSDPRSTANRGSGPGLTENPGPGSPAGGDGERGGTFDLSLLTPEQLREMEKRFLDNPAVKSEYEKRLKADPELAEDPQKRLLFFREMMQKFARRREL